MAKIGAASNRFADRLKRALVAGLKEAGIEAKVSTERIPTTKLHRVLVTAKLFEKLRPSERQDLVWRIVDRAFTSDEQLRISMIVALPPEQAGEYREAQGSGAKS